MPQGTIAFTAFTAITAFTVNYVLFTAAFTAFTAFKAGRGVRRLLGVLVCVTVVEEFLFFFRGPKSSGKLKYRRDWIKYRNPEEE